MTHTHIAHDCIIGNHTQFINGATLAGHVEVEDYAVIGAFSSVRQFVRIGRNSYIGGYTIVEQDILPYVKISQSRSGIDRDFVRNVKDILNIIYKEDMNTSQSVDKLKLLYPDSPEADVILGFLEKTKRGILKQFKSNK